MAVIPMLSYEDGAAAADWLVEAFGFEERRRFTDDDGTVVHAELEISGGMVMLATPSPDYVSPKRLRDVSPEARAMAEVPFVIDGVLVEVDDVDGHFDRARAAGATILSEPEDVPDVGVRHYRAEDPEGHRWMFSQDLP
jgi:PhnB protein